MSTQTARKPLPAVSMNETIENRIGETSRLVRKVDFSLSILTLLSVVLGVLLLAVLADHWLFTEGLSAGMRTVLFAGLVLAVGFYVYRRIVPLFLYPINPVYAASILEETSPSLKNSIVNWILLRRERTERGSTTDKLTERMFDGVTRTAASGVVGIPSDRAVDLRGIAHWGIVLTLLLLLFVGYSVFSPKSPMTSLARIMLPFSGIRTPQAVRFLDVEPGNHTALQGERLTVSAELVGQTIGQEPVYLCFSTDDGQAVRQAIPMSLPEGKTRYEAPFPPGKSGFVSGVDYWLQQGDSRSDKFRIDVRPTASIEVASLTYTYPAYTGLDEEVVEDGGDIRGVEGTEVRVAVRSTLPLQRVDLVMDNDPSKTVNMKPFGESEAAATLTLRHDPESQTPTTVRNYSFRAVDSDGYESRRSGIFRMEVLPDRPPVVQWSDTDEKLAENLKGADQLVVPLNGSLELPIQAEDPDFGLRYLRFHVESGNKRIRPVELLESLATGPTRHTGPIKAQTVFSPITSRLAEGDTAEIWAEAVDTKFPEPNSAVTRRITIVVGTPQKQEEPQQKEEKQDEKKDREKDKDQEKGENKEENDKKDGDEASGEENKETGDSEPENSMEKKDEKNSDDSGREDSKDGDKEKGEPESKENQENNEKDDKNSGDEQGNEQGGKQEDKPGETGEKQSGGDDSSTEKGERNSDENSSKNQGGDKQPGESGEQNQKDSKGDKNGAKKEKPVDPDTQDGDAMERIIEQMKKEKKLPGDDELQKDSAKSGQDEQKPEGKDEPKKDGQDKQKQDEKDEPQQKEQKKESKKDCPNKDCPGECSSCNGGGSKDGGKSGQGGKEGGEEGKQDGEQETGKPDGSKDDSKDGSKDSSDSGGDSGSSAGTDGTKKDGNQAGKPEGASGDDSEGEAENGAGGGEQSPGGKSGGDKNSGGGGPGDKDSDPSQRKNDNRNSDGEDIPVDPNDNKARERADSLDPNSQDRRSQGGDSTDPKRSDETAKDVPQNTVSSGDEGKGEETRQQGSGDRTQSAEDGDMKGEQGDSGVEQEGGSQGTGEKQAGEGGEQETSGSETSGSESDGSRESGSQQGTEGSQGDASTKPGQGAQGTSDSNDSSRSGSTLGPGGNGGSSQAGGPTPKDEANLEYTEKVTNLVLEYLEDQLKDGPNQDLLDNLGWTEQDLRKFHERWKEMSEQGRKPDLKNESDEWREALKSLGIRPSRERQEQRRSHSDFKDDGSSTESQRLAPPKTLQRQHQRYTEGIGTGRQ